VYVLCCVACNRIATEDDIEGIEESDDPVTCVCGETKFAAVKLPEEMVLDEYLVTDEKDE
jgi:hypothetical protein